MKDHLDVGVNIRMWSAVKEDLKLKAREMGVTPSTLARLIIERALESGEYTRVVMPYNLLPNQEHRHERE